MARLSHTIDDALDALRVSRATLYREIQAGRIRTYKIGTRRYISDVALRDYVADREAEAIQDRRSA